MEPFAIPVKLSEEALPDIQGAVSRPAYDRTAVKTGIVHIGPSAFFRGHLAVYADDLLSAGDMSWGICAISLKTSNVRDALKPQNYLYTVVEQSAKGNQTRVIGSLQDVMVAQENPQAVLDKLCSPETRLVTLTVTQAGYYFKNGGINFDDPDIIADMAKSDEPTSTIGFLVAALERRMKEGLPSFTVMSCDNLPGNGNILRNVILAFAAQRSPDLRDWIANNVEFPCTMVDRIVPKTSQDHISQTRSDYCIDDSWPIYTEKFRQFVIENGHENPNMPVFGSVGALVTKDVAPFELMKIRLLNGTHMALGVIGRMAGYTYAHEAINDPDIRVFIKGFMDEMTTTLMPVPGVDIEDYKAAIMDRLDSPFMKDELARLARNGVDKVESRFLSPLRDAISRQEDFHHISFAIAAWTKYLARATDPQFDILDTKAISMGLHKKSRQGGATVSILLSMHEIFGTDLPSSRPFTESLHNAMILLKNACHGPESVTEALRNRMNARATVSASTQFSPSLDFKG